MKELIIQQIHRLFKHYYKKKILVHDIHSTLVVKLTVTEKKTSIKKIILELLNEENQIMNIFYMDKKMKSNNF